MSTAKAFGWVTLVAGVWEILAPFIIGYSQSTGAMVDAIILGVLLLAFGLWVALSKSSGTVRTMSWVNAVLGLWLILAPFIIGYSGSTGALVNDIIVGGVVVILEVWGAAVAGKTE
jgi:hypothetical protein